MCYQRDAIERIRLHKCSHGTFHLNLGTSTLHLTGRELLMIHNAIQCWGEKHPLDFHDWVTAAADDGGAEYEEKDPM